METPKKVIEADRCLICSTVVAKKEKLYIFGKLSIDFCEIIKSALNVNVRNFSASEQLFICRAQCYQRLTKFKRTLNNLKKAKSELEEVYKATVHTRERNVVRKKAAVCREERCVTSLKTAAKETTLPVTSPVTSPLTPHLATFALSPGFKNGVLEAYSTMLPTKCMASGANLGVVIHGCASRKRKDMEHLQYSRHTTLYN